MYLAPEPSPKTTATPADGSPDQTPLPASGLSDFLTAPQIAWLLNVFPATDASQLAAFHAVGNPEALVSFLALPDYAALKSLLAIQDPISQQAYLNKILPAPLVVESPPEADNGAADHVSAQQHQPPETAAMMFPESLPAAGDGSGGGSLTVILQSSPQVSPELPGVVGAQGGSSGSMSQLELAPPAEVNATVSHGESGFISSGGEEASVLDDLGGANPIDAAEDIDAQADNPVVPENPAVGAAESNLAPGLANFVAHHPEVGGGNAGGNGSGIGIGGSSGTIFHLQHVAQHGLSNTELGIAVVGGLGVAGAITAAVVLSVENDSHHDSNNGTTPSPQLMPTAEPVLSQTNTPPEQADGHEDPPPTAAMMGPESGAPVGSGNLGGTVPVDSAGTPPVNLHIEGYPGTGSGTTSAGAGSNNSWSPSPSSPEQVEYLHHSFEDADVSQDGSGSEFVPQDLDPPAPQDGSGSGSDIVAEDFNAEDPWDGSVSDIVAENFSPPAPQGGFLSGNATQGLNPPAFTDPVNFYAGQYEADESALSHHAGENASSSASSDSGSRSPSPSFGFGIDMADPVNRITAAAVGVILVSTGVGLGLMFGTENHHANDNGADPAVAPPQNAIPLATLWAELAISGVDNGASAGSQQAHDFVASEAGIRTSLQSWISQNVPSLIVNLAGFDTMPAAGTGAATTVHVNIELSAKDANAVAGQLAMRDLSTILASLRDYDEYGLQRPADVAPDWHVQYMGMDVISGEIRQEEAVVAADDSGLASDYFAASNTPVPLADIVSNAAASDGIVPLEINGVQTTLWSI